MRRDPTIDNIFEPAQRSKTVSETHEVPHAAKFLKHSVDGGRARELLAGGVNDPRLAIHVCAGQAILFDEVRRLIGEGQHPAGLIAQTNPLRGARSKASGAVEEQK